MSRIIPFKRRKNRFARRYGRTPSSKRSTATSNFTVIAIGLLLGAGIGGGIIFWPSTSTAEASGTTYAAQFGFCHTGGGQNCVVDGDTFWVAGEKVRVMDIDAPETHPSRCQSEADLGNRATVRLHELLNEGPFQLESGGRDVDRYGRKLRIVTRSGHSLGEVLVDEGLAREWTGSRRPWC